MGLGPLADTRAYFPSREEAERFARQFDGDRYSIAIEPQPRQGREIFQVHVRSLETANPAAGDLVRLLGSVGDRARGAGLDGDLLARRMGKALGETLAAKEAPARVDRRGALERLGVLLQRCNLGALSVVSVTPLVLRVQGGTAHGILDRGRRCAHVAGFMEGALGTLLGKEPEVREMDCVGLGNTHCTFICEV